MVPPEKSDIINKLESVGNVSVANHLQRVYPFKRFDVMVVKKGVKSPTNLMLEFSKMKSRILEHGALIVLPVVSEKGCEKVSGGTDTKEAFARKDVPNINSKLTIDLCNSEAKGNEMAVFSGEKKRKSGTQFDKLDFLDSSQENGFNINTPGLNQPCDERMKRNVIRKVALDGDRKTGTKEEKIWLPEANNKGREGNETAIVSPEKKMTVYLGTEKNDSLYINQKKKKRFELEDEIEFLECDEPVVDSQKLNILKNWKGRKKGT